MVKIFY
jgi:hypothetical protein